MSKKQSKDPLKNSSTDPSKDQAKDPAKDSDREILPPLGEHIRKWRIKKGYGSYETFAIKYNLGISWYGDIERGKIDIQFTTLERIINGLGVSYKEFFSDFIK